MSGQVQEPGSEKRPEAAAEPEPVARPSEPTPAPQSSREPFVFDRSIKACLQHFSPELVTWLLREKPLEVEELDPKVVAIHELTADKLLRVKLEGKPEVALHVELQTQGRSDVPERVTKFLLLAGTSKGFKERGLHLASFVIYLDRRTYRDDPGRFELPAALGTSAVVTYTVVKLWEEDPEPIFELSRPGLCPFAPLMRGDPKVLFVKSRERIENAPAGVVSEGQKRVLLTTLAVLSGRVIEDQGFLRRCISKVRSMSDNWVIDELGREAREEGIKIGMEKGRREGREEGRVKEARVAVLQVLRKRFGGVPEDVRQRLEGVEDIERLESFLERAIDCSSLVTFQGILANE